MFHFEWLYGVKPHFRHSYKLVTPVSRTRTRTRQSSFPRPSDLPEASTSKLTSSCIFRDDYKTVVVTVTSCLLVFVSQHRPRRQQHLQHLVVDSIVDNTLQSSRQNRSLPTRLCFGRLLVAKLGPNCLWDLANRADPVPANAPVESGEPDVQCLITFVNT